MQRHSDGQNMAAAAVPSVIHEVLDTSGEELDSRARAFIEPRLGHEFSRVRVHTDARAAESARAVKALAYTVGQDIVFDTGRYQPQTRAGRRLLAHELTHVRQQAEEMPVRGRVQRLGEGAEAEDPLEREAAQAEAMIEEPLEAETSSEEPEMEPGEPLQGAATCPVTAVFSHIVVGAQKAGCQVPQGQFGVSKLAHFRLTGVATNQSVTITEQFKALDDPYNVFSALKPNSYTATNAEFDDCYSLASSKPLPSDLVLKVEQNHLYNGQIISKNLITYTPDNISFRACKRLPGKCDFATVCRL